MCEEFLTELLSSVMAEKRSRRENPQGEKKADKTPVEQHELLNALTEVLGGEGAMLVMDAGR